MTPRLSLWLDVLRVLAAFAVLLSHFAFDRFTGGRYGVIRSLNLGSDAVVIFFVLSGLVIAFAAETKDKTPAAYVMNRATRLWSVAVPALALTWALDRLGAALNPAAYPADYIGHVPAAALFLRGLTFSSEWLGDHLRLGSNGPWWSLSYEAAYYALFFCLFFLRGPLRLAGALFVLVIMGPRVVLLLPVWIAGAALWRMVRSGRLAMPKALAMLMAVLPFIAYAACLASGAPAALQQATAGFLGLPAAKLGAVFGYSDEFIWNWLIGLLVAIHLAGVSCLGAAAPSGTAARFIRWLAGGTFSLYLMHDPVLQFTAAMLPQSVPWMLRDALLLVFSAGVPLVLASFTERRLGRLRSALSGLFARLNPQGAPAAR